MTRTHSILTRSSVIAGVLNSGVLAASAPYGTAALPPEMATRPEAENCASLRSGTYRMVSPTLGGTLGDQTGKAVLDARKLTFKRPDGSQTVWQAKEKCRFVDPGAEGYSVDYVVSKTGVLVGRVTINGGSSFRPVIGFPEQPHALAEMAGNWSVLGLRAAPESFYPDAGAVTYDKVGVGTKVTSCGNAANWAVDVCTDAPPASLGSEASFVEDPSGGFVRTSPGRTTRAFLYTAGTGPSMLVVISSDASFFLATPVDEMDMPKPGFSTRSWNLDVTGKLAAPTTIYTITSLTVTNDQKNGSWVRSKQNVGLGDEHLEPLYANRPRPGYFHRPAGEARTSGGSVVRVMRFNEFTALNLQGMGFNVLVLPAVKLYEFSVILP